MIFSLFSSELCTENGEIRRQNSYYNIAVSVSKIIINMYNTLFFFCSLRMYNRSNSPSVLFKPGIYYRLDSSLSIVFSIVMIYRCRYEINTDKSRHWNQWPTQCVYSLLYPFFFSFFRLDDKTVGFHLEFPKYLNQRALKRAVVCSQVCIVSDDRQTIYRFIAYIIQYERLTAVGKTKKKLFLQKKNIYIYLFFKNTSYNSFFDVDQSFDCGYVCMCLSYDGFRVSQLYKVIKLNIRKKLIPFIFTMIYTRSLRYSNIENTIIQIDIKNSYTEIINNTTSIPIG